MRVVYVLHCGHIYWRRIRDVICHGVVSGRVMVRTRILMERRLSLLRVDIRVVILIIQIDSTR